MIYNILVDRLHIFGLERWPPYDKGIEDDTDRPCVHFETVAIRGIEQHFWRNIVWSATNGLLPFTRALNERGQSEVADFDIHVCIKE